MKKLSNTEAELKKRVAYKKKRVNQKMSITVCENNVNMSSLGGSVICSTSQLPETRCMLQTYTKAPE